MQEPFNDEEARELLELSEDELFTGLVPEHQRDDLYDEKGLAARGRKIFHARLAEIRAAVCPHYRKRKETINHSLDLMAILVPALAAVPSLRAISMTCAALIVKIGVQEICIEDDNDGK